MPPAQCGTSQVRGVNARMIKLLIVDDERTIRNGLARHMDWEKLGIGMVESAGSAEEAFAQCEKIRPDILLSDIRMRGMGGVEMCTQIHAQYPECQIILSAATRTREYLKAAISLGAVDYIEKPVRPELLAAAVKKALAACEVAAQGGSGRDGCREPRHGGENRAARAGAQRLSREFREMP